MRGGSQRPFGTFPKIHPFWSWSANWTLTDESSPFDHVNMSTQEIVVQKGRQGNADEEGRGGKPNADHG